MRFTYFNGRKRRPAVAKMYTKISEIDFQVFENKILTYKAYHYASLVELYRQQNLEEKNKKRNTFEELKIPNRDFKYSVAFPGIFAIVERPAYIEKKEKNIEYSHLMNFQLPGSSFLTTGTPFSSNNCLICNMSSGFPE